MTATWKTVRVFISSTFRDMQAERDHLVRFVFPKLRQELLQRRIHLVDVDLRWGVTSEQDALSVCREVVDECRPRFLCMLGGRYGWVPPGKTRSITADEVHYGVLDRDLTSRGFAYFYFRDPSATAAIVEVAPGEFREPAGSHGADALAELKTAIVEAGLQPFIYRAQWDDQSRRLTDLKAFGDRVYADLMRSIDEEYGGQASERLDEFAEENSAMEAFVEERTERFFLGSRVAVLNELLAHAAATGSDGYLCLVGEPGSGKSALLAHASQHPTLNAQAATLLISHFVGASPGSTDVRRTLRRLCNELKAGYPDITAEIPDDPEKLKVAFSDFLRQSCAKKRVVIILDAVNQFDSSQQTAGLRWLPEALPDNARVILSTLPGPMLDDLRQRHQPPREVTVKPLDVKDCEAIITEFLRRYRKAMTPQQRDELLKKADAGIPLYLLAVLEELRTLGTYEEIAARIAALPPTTLELFTWILKRLENDDGFRDASGGKIGRELVSRFVSLMGASRHGLDQQELVELLSPGDPQGNVAALLQLLRPYLMQRGELLVFYHGQFREAVATAYLPSESQRLAAHYQLASYFRDKADPEMNQSWKGGSPRPFSELPFHLVHAKVWPELVATIEEIFFLEAKAAYGMSFDLVRDFSDAMRDIPTEHPHHHILSLLEDALRQDIHFIARHTKDYPQGLFQCFWNSGWWYDCPQAAQHYVAPVQSEGRNKGSDGARLASLEPWQQPGPHLHSLLERWRDQKERADAKFPWLCALRPPPMRLGSAQLAVLRGHGVAVFSVAFSPQGDRIVSGSHDDTIRVWDASNGAELAVLHGHKDSVKSVAFSHRGDRIVSGSKDNTVRVWDASSGAELAVLRGHKSEVASVAFSPEGDRIVSGSCDGTARVWDARSGKELGVLHGHERYVLSVAFSPEGDRIVSGGADFDARVWDALNGNKLAIFSRHDGFVHSVAFSPAGDQVASGADEDNTVRLWDARNGKELAVLRGHEYRVASVAFSPDGDRIVSGSYDDTVRVWDVRSGKELVVLRGHEGFVHSVAFSPGGDRIVSGSADGTVRLWDARRGEAGAALRGHEDWLYDVTISPDGNLIASGSADKTIRVWDARNGAELAVLRGHKDSVNCVAFSQDGNRIASGSKDRTVRVWDTRSGAELTILRGHESNVNSVAFSPDGDWIVSGSDDKTVRIWDAHSGMDLAVLCGHEHSVESVAFSPDGDRIASGSYDKTVRMWNARSGAEMAVLHGHEDFVLRIVFSSDGNRIISKSMDNTSRVWDARDGVCTEVIEGDYVDVREIAGGKQAFPLRGRVRGLETIIERAGGGKPIAWFPIYLEVAHPSGCAWAAGAGNYLCLVRLEGCGVP
jgi:WD40 repeat protein